MITVFNRKELIVTNELNTYARIKDKLYAHGIKHVTKTNSFNHAGRGHGTPFYNHNYTCEYKIYVNKKDYDNAQYAIR